MIDAHTGQAAETYRYSAFGEEEIFDGQGNKITESSVNNPWRFASKRCDSETGWIYFGRRYYDHEIGRWTTPDPLSFTDGPNLYAYLHHNPLNAYDAYGLEGEAYRDSCQAVLNVASSSVYSGIDRSDVYSSNQSRSEYICNAAQNVYHGAAGIFHGEADFFTNQVSLVATLSCYFGSFELDDSFEDIMNFNNAFHQSQTEHVDSLNGWISDTLRANPDHSVYQSSRSITTTALEYGSLLLGGYAVAKGAVKAVSYATLTYQAEKMAGKVAAQGIKCGVREGASNVVKTASRNRFTSNSLAEGAHTVFRRDPISGKVTRYETFSPQTNFQNPNPWESVKRYDGSSLGPGQMAPSHFNKVLQQKIYEPHVHDPFYPGGIRSALPWETP